MTPTLIALIGFALWTIALTVLIGGSRAYIAQTTGKAPNTFAANGEDVGGFSQRLARAHANCYENLPVVAAILLSVQISGMHALSDPLAPWILLARVLQSIVHLASTSVPAVLLRFGFFVVQIGLLLLIALRALTAG